MKKNVLWIAVTIPLWIACQPQAKQTEQAPIAVEVMTIDSTSSMYTHTYVGQTEDADVVSLSFGMMGTIRSVNVHNGDRVKEGQVLATLDDTKSRAALESAKAKYKQAQDGYRRAKQVYNQGGVSEVKMIEIRTQLTEAEQLVAGLRNQVANCTLRAPMAGVIDNVSIYKGENVLPDITVMNLHNRAGKNIVFAMPEQDIVRMQVGDYVEVTIPTLHRTYTARVTERSLSPQNLSRNYEVTCLIEGQTDDILPGMSGKVRCLSDRITGFMIPAHCVQTYEDGLVVWVCKEGKAQRIRVESSSFSRDGVLITQGLSQGDHVIVNGYQKLYNGARVYNNF